MTSGQIKATKGGRQKTQLFRGHVPYHGEGGRTPPAKKVSFRQNVKNTQHAQY